MVAMIGQMIGLILQGIVKKELESADFRRINYMFDGQNSIFNYYILDEAKDGRKI